MTALQLDQVVADFTSTNSQGEEVKLSDLKGKNVVIYFYPKDNTPGCTTEGQNFRDLHEAFGQLNTVIFGVSKDSVRTHINFRNKHKFPFELLSDPEESLCKHFDVIKLKKMYGKEYLGIERSTFIIDAEGLLRNEWRKVKVKGHVDEVLDAVKSL